MDEHSSAGSLKLWASGEGWDPAHLDPWTAAMRALPPQNGFTFLRSALLAEKQ